MKTLRTPIQLDAAGRMMTTEDPAVILEQQVTDMLVTYRGERLMLPNHGADLLGFIFSPIRDDFMSLKADEVKGYLNRSISFGEIVSLSMTPIEDAESSVRLTVFYRLTAAGPVQQFTQIFTGYLTEESEL